VVKTDLEKQTQSAKDQMDLFALKTFSKIFKNAQKLTKTFKNSHKSSKTMSKIVFPPKASPREYLVFRISTGNFHVHLKKQTQLPASGRKPEARSSP